MLLEGGDEGYLLVYLEIFAGMESGAQSKLVLSCNAFRMLTLVFVSA